MFEVLLGLGIAGVLIIIGAILLVILLIVLIVSGNKKKKKKKAMDQLIQDKERERILDSNILNPYASNEDIKGAGETPYSVNYTSGERKGAKGGKRHLLMLQIEEISDLSNKKYMLDPLETITIGSAKDNKISLSDALIDARQCEIGLYERDNKTLYLQNVGEKRVILLRKKEWINVGPERLVLLNGDIIELGRIQLKITVV